MTDSTDTRRRIRRGVKYALIGVYLVALATVPQYATLSFGNKPALEGKPQLQTSEEGRYRPLSWDLLAGFLYEFELPGLLEDASAEEVARRSREIPERVRALNGQQIALRGYVIPTHMEGNRIRAFILAAKNEIGCCFGEGLAMNQWVAVEVDEDADFWIGFFELATVFGELEVGEEIQDGYVMSLYRMSAQRIRKG